jgi:hypothetical protein
MLSDTTVMAAMTAYADRIARAEHELFVAEALQATWQPLSPRMRMGAALVHLGTRMMAPAGPAALPWRTVQISR